MCLGFARFFKSEPEPKSGLFLVSDFSFGFSYCGLIRDHTLWATPETGNQKPKTKPGNQKPESLNQKPFSMREEEYRAMFELEERMWWYEGMRAVTASMLGEAMASLVSCRILDVGCGTGFSMSWLSARSGASAAFGIDVSEHAAEFWRRRGLDTIAVGAADALPFPDNEFDLVTCFDVVYQLEPRAACEALAEMNRVVKRGGLLFIREPAYDWLRGSHDVAVATRHRYTRSELRRLLESRGFVIRRASYANTLLFPAAAAHRMLSKGGVSSDVRETSALLNGAFAAALKLEAKWLRRMSFPFGLSVIALAEKS